MSGQTSTNRLLGLFAGVAIIMLLANWSLMRAVAFAVIWSIAAVVLVVRDRRRAAQSPATNSPATDG